MNIKRVLCVGRSSYKENLGWVSNMRPAVSDSWCPQRRPYRKDYKNRYKAPRMNSLKQQYASLFFISISLRSASVWIMPSFFLQDMWMCSSSQGHARDFAAYCASSFAAFHIISFCPWATIASSAQGVHNPLIQKSHIIHSCVSMALYTLYSGASDVRDCCQLQSFAGNQVSKVPSHTLFFSSLALWQSPSRIHEK